MVKTTAVLAQDTPTGASLTVKMPGQGPAWLTEVSPRERTNAERIVSMAARQSEKKVGAAVSQAMAIVAAATKQQAVASQQAVDAKVVEAAVKKAEQKAKIELEKAVEKAHDDAILSVRLGGEGEDAA